MPSNHHNPDHVSRLLEELERGPRLSQRSLAARLGIALGHTNQLLRGAVREGWVRAIQSGDHRTTYVVTQAGAEMRLQMSREVLGRAVASYEMARHRIGECLAGMTAPPASGSPESQRLRMVIYGTGDVARIAFACAVEAGITLVGFVEDSTQGSFLGLPVRRVASLAPLRLGDEPFDWLLIGALSDHDGIRLRLDQIGFPLDRVGWL